MNGACCGLLVTTGSGTCFGLARQKLPKLCALYAEKAYASYRVDATEECIGRIVIEGLLLHAEDVERDVEKLASQKRLLDQSDVADSKVSAERALEDYGVVLRADGTVDHAATQQYRLWHR